jgi:hypothetical protein
VKTLARGLIAAAILVTVAVSLISSCYRVGFADCTVKCGDDSVCPSNMLCADHLCRHSVGRCLAVPDGSAGDAARDAPRDAPHDAASDGHSDRHSNDMGLGGDGGADRAGNTNHPVTMLDGGRADRSDGHSMSDSGSDGTGPGSDAASDATSDSDASSDAGNGPCGRHQYLNVVRHVCLPAHDLNGDGKADLVAANNGETDALLSTGHSFTFAKWFDGNFYGGGGIYAADVTGDSYADGVGFQTGFVGVVTTGGPGFGALASNYSNWMDKTFLGTKGTFVVDVTGEGKSDAIAVNPDGIQVALSTGSSFSPPAVWLAADLSSYTSVFFADVTGDGLADGIFINDSTADVSVSSGHALGVPVRWRASGIVGPLGTFFADVDGDGRADGIRLDSSSVGVSLARAGSFAKETQWYAGPIIGPGGTFVADADGDGMADIISIYPSYVTVATSTGHGFSAPVVWYTGQFRTDYGITPAPDPGVARAFGP